MMNVQFPLSPHSQLITIPIDKVFPTSAVDTTDQGVTSSVDLSLSTLPNLDKFNGVAPVLRTSQIIREDTVG